MFITLAGLPKRLLHVGQIGSRVIMLYPSSTKLLALYGSAFVQAGCTSLRSVVHKHNDCCQGDLVNAPGTKSGLAADIGVRSEGTGADARSPFGHMVHLVDNGSTQTQAQECLCLRSFAAHNACRATFGALPYCALITTAPHRRRPQLDWKLQHFMHSQLPWSSVFPKKRDGISRNIWPLRGAGSG